MTIRLECWSEVIVQEEKLENKSSGVYSEVEFMDVREDFGSFWVIQG